MKNTKDKSSSILEWIILVSLFCLIVFVVPNFVLQKTRIDGNSMEKTLYEGEFVLQEKVSNYFSNPNRFDLIIFYSDTLEEDCVKRVIGLPGEEVQIIGSKIYINGSELKESYGKDPITNPGLAKKPIKLGKDEFFVLGDNRKVSFDSRSKVIGIVKKNQMDGRVLLRVWPLSKFGKLK